MAEKQDKTLQVFITSFIVILLALAFITSLSDQTNVVTSKTNVADESFNLQTLSCYSGGQVNESKAACTVTVTNAPTSWKSEDCPLTNVVVTNNTGTVLLLDTDYTLTASTGTIVFKNTTSTVNTSLGNVALVDYSYCGTGYVNSSWGRTLLGTNTGLFAIAILVAGIALAYTLLGKKGDDD